MHDEVNLMVLYHIVRSHSHGLGLMLLRFFMRSNALPRGQSKVTGSAGVGCHLPVMADEMLLDQRHFTLEWAEDGFVGSASVRRTAHVVEFCEQNSGLGKI